MKNKTILIVLFSMITLFATAQQENPFPKSNYGHSSYTPAQVDNFTVTMVNDSTDINKRAGQELQIYTHRARNAYGMQVLGGFTMLLALTTRNGGTPVFLYIGAGFTLIGTIMHQNATEYLYRAGVHLSGNSIVIPF